MESISETFVCIGEKGRFCEEDVVKEEKPTASSDCKENDSTIANTSPPKSKTVRFCTPQGQLVSPTDGVKQVNSLETLYARLKDRVADYLTTDAVGQGHSAEMAASDVNASNSEVWVARYIHYTSKYGLGFLFNTGSAGVYFNDSTKIVLSADGKKVSLLLQFRNYLVDQQRKNEGTDFSQRDFPLKRDGENSTGDNMVYLHKWVRTKRAFLFCLSNRTIQVVFCDRSEVILAAGGLNCTYVNKLGQRSEHTIDDNSIPGI
eukprot:gene15351-17565_t